MDPKLIDDAGNISRTANSTLREIAAGEIEDAKHSALMAAFYALAVLEKLCGTDFEFFEIWQQAEAIKARHDLPEEVRA